MNKNTVIALVVTGLVVIAGYLLFTSSDGGTIQENYSGEEVAVVVKRTDNGYEPSHITIQKGDIVLWTNESSEYHWPASDLHPTHGIYPEFDPLKPIAPGDEWRFRFDQVGEWKFHDHIRANKVGTVTVVE